MFNGIVAIDVASRIPRFYDRIKEIASEKPLTAPNAHALTLSFAQAQAVDALLISIYEDANAAFLQKFPSLRYIGVLGTSLKRIDTDYCQRKGIKVTQVKDYCDEETAEWVILHILKFFRERSEPLSVFGKSLGLIGYGSVAKKVAVRAKSLGMNLLINSTEETQASKERIFAECDVISLHTPAHLVWLSYDLLHKLRPGALIINTCMGKVSLASDLEDFLTEREDISLVMDAIAHANYEKLTGRAFCDIHAAYKTDDSSKRLFEQFFDNARLSAAI